MKYLLLSVCVALSACAAQPSRQLSSEKGRVLTLIATTDLHGALEAEEFRLPDGKPMQIGGAPLLSSYVRTLREKTGPSLVIDAGDLFQGTMASNLYEGTPVIRFYNYLGVTAAALGNHEFDFGPVGPKAVPTNEGDDPQGALKARIAEARFPILAANVRDGRGRLPEWLKASILKDVGGIKVGIVGAAGADTPSTTNALNLKGLKFLDPLEPVKEEAERLRAQGAEIVILTIHEGGGCNDNSVDKQDDLSSCTIKDILNLAAKLPDGLVNAIVAGHTHRPLAKRVNHTVILQSASGGKYVGWAEIPAAPNSMPEVKGMTPVCVQVLNGDQGPTCDSFQLKKAKGTPVPAQFLGVTMRPDKDAEKLLEPELKEVKKLKEVKLGVEAEEDFERNYKGESALGNLVADLTKGFRADVDIGMTNGGGLRANLSRGSITYGDVFNILPFDNQLAVITISGQKLMELAQLGQFGGQGALLYSANVRTEAEGCQVKRVFVDNQPVSPAKRYKIATSDFLAGGGSGIASLKIPASDITYYWDKEYILRDLTANSLKNGKVRSLRVADYFDPAHPRQITTGQCAQKQIKPEAVIEH